MDDVYIRNIFSRSEASYPLEISAICCPLPGDTKSVQVKWQRPLTYAFVCKLARFRFPGPIEQLLSNIDKSAGNWT